MPQRRRARLLLVFRRLVALLGILGAVAAPAGASANPDVEQERAVLESRVHAVRASLRAADASFDTPASADRLAQWFNWPNWVNWNNWNNWANWGNWFNR